MSFHSWRKRASRPAAYRNSGLRLAHGLVVAVLGTPCTMALGQELPNAPSALLSAAATEGDSPGVLLPPDSPGAGNVDRQHLPSCTEQQLAQHRAYLLAGLPGQAKPRAGAPALTDPRCRDTDRLQIVVDSKSAARLSSRDKARLAVRDVIDPFNLIFVAGYSAVAIAANSHSAYGPGFGGFGKLLGYSLLQDAQGEFMGTYLIPTLAHQDPRYHRLPAASVKRRVLHALAHTVVTSHDDGSAMPNYATLLTYPLSAELSNLYVPGIETDSGSTAKRILIGLATDPAGSLVAEFLPDVAKRIHIRVVFVQEILNQVITGAPNVQ